MQQSRQHSSSQVGAGWLTQSTLSATSCNVDTLLRAVKMQVDKQYRRENSNQTFIMIIRNRVGTESRVFQAAVEHPSIIIVSVVVSIIIIIATTTNTSSIIHHPSASMQQPAAGHYQVMYL
jgi:isopropylmalate/homocitrate/citramalate synthase